MISSKDRSKDAEDVGVLFYALIRYVEAKSEDQDISVVSVGFGNLLQLAESAATEIALRCADEGDEWDGCVWFERLESIDDQSLAGALLVHDVDMESTVQKWLLTFGWIEFLHGTQRWSFDGDQLATWDEEEQAIHFHAYHSLTEPTVESVIEFIDQN